VPLPPNHGFLPSDNTRSWGICNAQRAGIPSYAVPVPVMPAESIASSEEVLRALSDGAKWAHPPSPDGSH